MIKETCKYVYEILVYETEADHLNLIQTKSIDIRFLSEEYENRDFTGKQYCVDHGIEIYYHLRRHNYSSTELRNRIYFLEKQKRELKEEESQIPPHSLELLDKYST